MSDFKVGDKVVVKDTYENGNFHGQIGKIVYVDEDYPNGDYGYYFLIKFDDDFHYPPLHDGDGIYPEERCWWINPIDLEEKEKFKKRKKLKKPEIDPFDEEKWGYIQESSNEGIKSYTIWDKYLEIRNPNKMDEYLKKELIGKIVEFEDKYHHIYSDKMIDVGYEYSGGFYFITENGIKHYINIDYPIKYIVGKKIKNPEMDPFDEENWGFVQEKKKEDDDVIYILVTPRLKYWIVEKDWKMDDFIGKIFIAERSNQLKSLNCGGGSFHLNYESMKENNIETWTYDWYVPYDSAKIVSNPFKGRKKLKKPEIDPFDEEKWGYIQENADDKTIGIEDLVNYHITFKNVEEMEEVATILSKYYEVHNMDIILGDDPDKYYNVSFDYKESWNFFKYVSILGGQKKFSRNSGSPKEYMSINLEMLKKITSGGLKKKLKKPEIDPFDEEKWGFVQESVDVDEIEIGDEVYLSPDFKIENDDDREAKDVSSERGVVNSINKHHLSKHPIEVSWSNGEMRVYKLSELELCKKRKKLNKPEIDPFGEEKWWE